MWLCSTVSALIVPAKSLTKSRLADCSAVGPPPANPGLQRYRAPLKTGIGSAGAPDRFVVARRRGVLGIWQKTSRIIQFLRADVVPRVALWRLKSCAKLDLS